VQKLNGEHIGTTDYSKSVTVARKIYTVK